MSIDLSSKRRASLLAISGAVVLGLAAALVVPAVALVPVAAGAPAGAHAARHLSIHETATLRLIGYPKGHVFNERGTVSGTYRGSTEARLVAITNTKWEATLTVYTSGGSLKAKATARARPVKEEEVIGYFLGSASITGGTGTWAHTSGSLTFNGSINRRTFQVSADMSGTLNV
jgi:hypothetical protein